jgi:hypothetical protein
VKNLRGNVHLAMFNFYYVGFGVKNYRTHDTQKLGRRSQSSKSSVLFITFPRDNMENSKTDEGEKKEEHPFPFILEPPRFYSRIIAICEVIGSVFGMILGGGAGYVVFHDGSFWRGLFFLILATAIPIAEFYFKAKYTWKKWEVDLKGGFVKMYSTIPFEEPHLIWMGEICLDSVHLNSNRLWYKENNKWRSLGPIVFPKNFFEEFRNAVKAAGGNGSGTCGTSGASKTSFDTFLWHEQSLREVNALSLWKKKPNTETYYCGKPTNGGILLIQVQFEVSSAKWEIAKSKMSEQAWKHFENVYQLVSCSSVGSK